MKIVFTDLDGTLLDSETYTWAPAQQALELLAAQGVPWVMVSSKTRAEMEALRRNIGHTHPFVVENGAAAFIPRGYFGDGIEGAVARDAYDVIEWGTPYADLVAGLKKAAAAVGCPVTGFADVSIADVAAWTGLPLDDAARAKQREYDEPFMVADTQRAGLLLQEIERHGYRWTHGGRFYHICGNNDKAIAVSALTRRFALRWGPVTTLGLGDGLNDLPLLQAVDVPVLVRSMREPSPELLPFATRMTRSIGPAGWNEAVTEFLTGPPSSEVAP